MSFPTGFWNTGFYILKKLVLLKDCSEFYNILIIFFKTYKQLKLYANGQKLMGKTTQVCSL